MPTVLALSEELPAKTWRLRSKLLRKLARRLRDRARVELEPVATSALARFGFHFGIPARRLERLSADLLTLEPLLRQTLEAEALACRRAVAWDRAQAPRLPKLQPWVVLELEALQRMKFSELRPRDWPGKYKALPQVERDRLRRKGQRQGSPYFRRGAPVLRAHPIIEARAQLIAAAIADGTRARHFRTLPAWTSGQLRYLARRLPFSRRSGSPAWDLLLASLRYALPINATLHKGLPERSVARVAETLTQA